jgi:2-polyprenyl-6-methoxyphenol hydroxylase-like FAD-dependent oxidoreductase
MSTHYIHQPGVARLARWGLLDAVLASNCPPIEHIRIDAGALALEGAPTPCGDVAIALCPRRVVLDKILVDAAARAGAEVREGFVVEELDWEDGRVSGIRGRDLRGAAVCHERAQIVIGADGPWSQIARAVDAPEYETVPALTCGYYSYFSGVRLSACEVHPRHGCSTLGFATNDGLTCVAIERPRSEFETWRTDIEGGFLKTLESAPDLCARVRAGKREERFSGTGITDAFRDAELLAEAAGEGLAGREPMEQALAGYESARNAASMDLYHFTCEQARLEGPSPMLLALMTALANNAADTRRFMGAVATTVAMSEFYAPSNLIRIMQAADRS